jgi:hypothetical protein
MEPRRKLVVATLKGGIGNQLFQYAAGLTVSSQIGAELRVVRRRGSESPLKSDLALEFTSLEEERARRIGLGDSPRGAWTRLKHGAPRRLARGRGQYRVVRQPDTAPFAPNEMEFGSVQTLVLDGYFQHPSWFQASKSAVLERLRIVLPISEVPQGTTVISIRRGDYVPLGWALPFDYYEHALTLIDPGDGPTYLVGDDPLVLELLSDHLKRRGWMCAALPDRGTTPIVRDLALLAAARNVIMSNSTFCWWGVATGEGLTPDRTVLAPSDWLPIEGSTSLLRPDWTLIETRRSDSSSALR